jgi:hypothetical protein
MGFGIDRQSAAGRLLLLAGVMAALALSVPSHAGRPPAFFQELQRKAPEALEIVVLTAHSTLTKKSTETVQGVRVDYEFYRLDITAIVERVRRSATGLKPLSIIKISYPFIKKFEPTPVPPTIGGSGEEPSVLAKGDRVPAFLERGAGGVYEPFALKASFRRD